MDDDSWVLMIFIYFRSFRYFDETTFISLARGVTDPKFYYKEYETTTVLGSVIPSGFNDFVIAMRGFFKAPASGELLVLLYFIQKKILMGIGYLQREWQNLI